VNRLAAALLLAFLPATAVAQPTGRVTGRVVRADADVPVSGARVLVADSTREATTDHDGRFVLNELPAGEVLLVFLRDGFAVLSQPVAVLPGGDVSLDVELPLAPTLSQELTVLGRVSDYLEATASAARTSERLLNVPQAVQVLPEQFLADIGALDTKDLYKHISGVTDSAYSSTVVRGFTQREVLINGVRGNPYGSLDGDINGSGFSTSQFRLSNVERVEVLKGPSSVLYGSSEPGGVINYVTRRPREQFDVRATVGGGQFDQRIGELDMTGPLTASGSVLARGAVYLENRDSFRFNSTLENTHAVGGLTWRASPSTTVMTDYEYIRQHNGGHRLRGVPVSSTGEFAADHRWTATEPTDYTNLGAHVAQARLDHLVGRGSRVDATFRYLSYDRREEYHEPRGLSTGGTQMQRDFRNQLRTNDDWTLSVNGAMPLATGRVRHEVAIGTDVVHQDHLFRFATVPPQSAGGPVPPLSLLAPTYGTTSGTAYQIAPERFAVDTAQTTRSGAYVQDLLTLGPRWRALLSTRVDRYDDRGDTRGIALDATRNAVTGRAGLVFKPADQVSLYGNVSNGFTRASILAQTPRANGPHAPETSRQVELGAKTDVLGGRAQVTLAAFDTVKRNVLRPDPDFGPFGDNFNAVLATGEVRNRGVEVDLAGQLRHGWNMAFNYAWLDSAITRDSIASLVGRPMPNAAPHAGGLFTRVDLPRGTAVAASVEYVATRHEPFANMIAPAYTVVDLHLFKQLGDHLRVLVRADNIFDRRYSAFSLFAGRVGNMPGHPRMLSVLLTVTRRGGAPRSLP
jgi:iron complex outermembrane recepter protein